MQNKSQRRPLIDPLVSMLRSRRVLIALASFIVGYLMLIAPELEPLRAELLVLVVSLALALIGGYSLEDAVGAARQVSIDQQQPGATTAGTLPDDPVADGDRALWRSGNIEDRRPDYTPR